MTGEVKRYDPSAIHSSLPTRLCVDCKWYKHGKPSRLHHVRPHSCTAPQAISPVTGEQYSWEVGCWSNRQATGDCGPEGLLFEEKELSTPYEQRETENATKPSSPPNCGYFATLLNALLGKPRSS